MRIHLLSDLHLETGPFDPPRVEADVTVLAGDIWTKGRGVEWASRQFPDRPVLYVLGNHEYYAGAWPGMLKKMKETARGTNVHILEQEGTEVGGVTFLGGTLWSDFGLHGDASRGMAAAAQGMNDYRAIRVSPEYRRLRPTDTLLIHRDCIRWLHSTLQASEGTTVVVTHHAPSGRCLPEREAPSLLDSAYASDLEGIMEETKPILWLHGHLHLCRDLLIGETRVLSNCRGYAHEEAAGFDPGLVVEIG